MTDREFYEGVTTEQKILKTDKIIRENLRCGYQMEVRFEDQIRRVDEMGKRAFDIISAI